MARFAIYEKNSERRVLREGANKYAFLFTSFWLIAKGLWLEALATFAFVFFAAFPLLASAPLAGLALSFLPGVYLWLEGNTLVAARLLRRGRALVALLEASSEEGAQLQYELHRATGVATPPPLPKVGGAERSGARSSRPKVQGGLKGLSPFGLEGL